MSRLKKTSDLVRTVLQEVPETRNNDDVLYAEVCKRVNSSFMAMSFRQVLLHRKELGFPPFESVRRSRQKIQQHHPELSACSLVEGYRALEEEMYKNYARRRDDEQIS